MNPISRSTFRCRWIAQAASLPVALALTALSGVASAQTGAYPNRPITMVVSFAVGGATDLAARALASHLSEKLGQSVVVDNAPGASTSIGTARVARAPKDGYTVLFSTASTFTITPHLKPKLDINLDDFDLIAPVGSVSFALATRRDFPARNLNEFVAAAKARPKGINNATPGAGSVSDILSRYVYKKFGITVEEVHYRGEGPAMLDLLSGRTDTLFVSLPLAAQHLNAGSIHSVAISGRKRSPLLPNVPTFIELGFADLFGDSWQIVMVPTGTPAPIVARLNTAINEIARQPAFIEQLAKLGAETMSAPPAEIRMLLLEERKRWGAVVVENKITVD